LALLAAVALGTLGFLLGGLSCGTAAILTALLPLGLAGLAWKRFDQGRHPCFFFLCLLTLFQAGRLLVYGTGSIVTDPFRVTLMTPYLFDIPREAAGSVLLALALSAICVYAPCRWNYRCARLPIERPARGEPNQSPGARFLPYLYLLLGLSVPLQLFKNYRYYVYAQEHGGYLVFFTDHVGMAASIPLVVRAISLITLPALMGLSVLERKRKHLRMAVMAYFLTAAPVLLTGSRGAIFSLVLALWYVAQVQSRRRIRLYGLGLLVGGLMLGGAWIGSLRIGNGQTYPFAGPLQFLADQGMSLNVTEVAVANRGLFAPHMVSYLTSELQSAFVAGDQTRYVPGKRFADDVAVFLNPVTYELGFGSGSAYVAEAYVAGGLGGVALISALLGLMLHGLHAAGRHPLGLFLSGLILPDVLWMSRGGLLDWVSAAARAGISLVLLAVGWQLYQAAARAGHFLGLGAGKPSVGSRA
jgi:hypothetical protein